MNVKTNVRVVRSNNPSPTIEPSTLLIYTRGKGV
jgi:hypothetical protein